MNDDQLRQLSERLARLEKSVEALNSQLAHFGQQLGRALNDVLFSQATYLGNGRALTFLQSGQKIFVDTASVDIGTHLLAQGLWEANYVKAFIGLLKPGNIVLDIGANHGVYSLLAARAIGPRGKIFAFEPNPRFADLIRASVSVNGLADVVTLVQAALSSKESEVELVVDPGLSGGGHIGTDRDVSPTDTRHRVRCIALDDYPDLSDVSVDVIKMDIEGAEGLALQGMRRMIERSPRLKIMMEFCPAMLNRYEIDASQVAAFFESRAFMCWDIDAEGALHPASWNKLLQDRDRIRNIVVSRTMP